MALKLYSVGVTLQAELDRHLVPVGLLVGKQASPQPAQRFHSRALKHTRCGHAISEVRGSRLSHWQVNADCLTDRITEQDHRNSPPVLDNELRSVALIPQQ